MQSGQATAVALAVAASAAEQARTPTKRPTPLAVFIAFDFVDERTMAAAKIVCRRWSAAVNLQNSPLDLRLLRGAHRGLHRDIFKFDARLGGVSATMDAWRATALEYVQKLVLSIWPQSTVKVYGSCAHGLASPQSDIDIAVCNAIASVEYAPHAVLMLAQAFASVPWIHSVKVSVLLFTVTFYANRAHNLTRSP